MENEEYRLSPNALAFIALCNEYCQAMESASLTEPSLFVGKMVKLLPRLYISAADLQSGEAGNAYLEPAMDEEKYIAVQSSVAALLGEHDTYLEVFEEDMKYSDTPIAASISEGLADIMQPLYNFIEVVRDAPVELVEEALSAIAEDFRNYWSRVLCNQMRPLNALHYSGALAAEDY